MQQPIPFIAAALALIVCSPAFAVYQCKDSTGRTAFQERPCDATGTQGKQIQVRPASGAPAPGVTDATQPASTPHTEAQRLRALNERSSKETRMHNIKYLDLPAARAGITRATNECNRKMAETKSKKALANNNLAGATWEQSLSTEMQAIATQCSADQTRLNATLDRLLAEQRTLEQELRQ